MSEDAEWVLWPSVRKDVSEGESFGPGVSGASRPGGGKWDSRKDSVSAAPGADEVETGAAVPGERGLSLGAWRVRAITYAVMSYIRVAGQ